MPSRDALNLALWALEALLLALRQRLRPLEVPREPARILVLGYGAVGDTIFLLPALAALRRRFPSAKMTFVADLNGEVTCEFIPGTGLFDEIELVDWWEGRTRAERLEMESRLNSKGFDAVVMSYATPAHYFQRVIARIPLRAGHCERLAPPLGCGWLWKLRRALVTGMFSRRLLLNRIAWIEPKVEHALRRNLRLAALLGAQADSTAKPTLPAPVLALERASRELPKDSDRALVGVHLGIEANPYHKIWSVERFGSLCKRLERSGRVECVLFGGPQERAGVAKARQAAGRELRSWVGERSLLETFALIGRCDLFISSDTGLAKAAMALGVPTATLWGPADPRELGVVWDPQRHLDLSLELACSPCVRAGMPYPRQRIHYATCGHHNCVRTMGVEWVYEALLRKYPEFLAVCQ